MGQLRRLRDKGFSLVELLVSMLILSLLVLLSSYSYSQFARHWDGRLGDFDSAFSELRNGWLLDDIFRNVHPYVVRNSEGLARFYFEGNVSGFVAVSSESLSEVAVGAVIRLSLVPNKDQTFDLIYEEAPMRRAALTRLTAQPKFSSPVVLLSNLDDPEFTYFGTEMRRAQSDDAGMPRRDLWTDSYNSALTQSHPKKIRFQWTTAGGVVDWMVELMQPLKGQLSSAEEDLGL